MSENSEKTSKSHIPENLRENAGQWSKDNQPSPEAKKAGWAKWRARKDLRDDLFKTLVELGTFDEGVIAMDRFMRSEKASDKDKAYFQTKLTELCATPDTQKVESTEVSLKTASKEAFDQWKKEIRGEEDE